MNTNRLRALLHELADCLADTLGEEAANENAIKPKRKSPSRRPPTATFPISELDQKRADRALRKSGGI